MLGMIRTLFVVFVFIGMISCGTDPGFFVPGSDVQGAVDSIASEPDAKVSDVGEEPSTLCDEAKSRMAADPCLNCLCDENGITVCEGLEIGSECTIENCCFQDTYCMQCALGDDSCGESGLSCTGTPNIECATAGECLKSFPVCTEDTCTCSETPKDAGSACTADSNACTVGDFCAGDECIQGALLDLDDGNVCTLGICVKGEVVQQVMEGQCSDGNPCTIEEECKLGQCVAEKLRECELKVCTQTAYCDPETGECAWEYSPDGSPCLLEDSECGADGRCESGECIPIGNEMEICDGIDNDCDGQIDEDQPILQCGEGTCISQVPSCIGGVVQVCVAVEGTPEICDGVDNDCDGQTDEDLGELTCGLGPCSNSVQACMNGAVQWCLPQFDCCPNGITEPGEECDDGDLENDDWCSSDCKETGQTCNDGDAVSTQFIGIDNTSVGVGTWCNFGCFAYWATTLDDIAWAWVCDGEIFVCPLGLTDCTGTCPNPECIPAQ